MTRLLDHIDTSADLDTRYDRIEVAWPGGDGEVFPGGSANRIVVLEQGTGTPAPAIGRPAAPRP